MKSISESLENAPAGQDDYTAFLHDLLDGVQELEDPEAFFAAAFRFFEEHSGADLGAPGPLVHLLERFYPDYLDFLCASAKRKPTTYSVWMINRILNAELPVDRRTRLLALLRQAADNPAADVAARRQATAFLRQLED